MKTYRNGESANETFSSNKFGGVIIAIYCEASANNTPLVDADVNLAQMNFDFVLNRSTPQGQMNHQIIQGNAEPLIVASAFPTAMFGFCDPSITDNASFTILRASAVGVKELGMKSFYIPFGGVIDCEGLASEIVANVSVGASFFGTNLSSANSFVQIDMCEAEGIEDYIPKLTCQVIPENETSPSYSVSGMVKRLCFVNLDKTSSLLADQVISTMNINTERGSSNLNYYELLSLRAMQFEGIGQEERAQSFDLIPFQKEKIYTSVRVTPVLNSSNVNASKNWFVLWSGVASASSLYLSATSQIKKNQLIKSLYATSTKMLDEYPSL